MELVGGEFNIFAAVLIFYVWLLLLNYSVMTIVAWVGLFGLIGGLFMGLRSRRKGLLWFLVPVLLSQLYLGLYLGLCFYLQPTFSSVITDYFSIVFLVIETCVLLALIIRLKGARIPAASLSVFCIAYALVAISLP